MTIGGIDPPVGAGAREATSRQVDTGPDQREDAATPGTERSGRATRRPVQRLSLAAATFLTGGSRRRAPEAPETLIPLVQVHRAHHPKADIALLQRAFVVAELSHRGQMRKSGEAYITHPLAVATILAELGADTTTLVAALLHDTVEDTDLTIDVVRESFGDGVAHLVDGVTKLEKVDFNNRQEAEAETMRKILVATGRDLRVTVIKLADRLHNMRTIRHMRRASQIRIAEVTRDVFIPLAERLGIHVVKAELEDIVFATLQPEDHADTVRALADGATERDEAAADLADTMRRELRDAGVSATVTPRHRHHVSARRVKLRRGDSALGPFDLSRLMVVVDADTDCYAALGVLHTRWAPLAGEFKDFIATPKFNLYQSLHTAISLPGGDIVEVLIRTRRMHRLAEFGVVAHTGDDGSKERGQLEWLHRLLAWQGGIPDATAFWSQLTADLSADRELLVFTPGGRPLTLPAGSTCVDAAYAIGEQTGHRCIGAQVNGRLVALSSVLADGETVSIITAPPHGAGPSREWLGFVRSPLARVAIESWLAEHPESGEGGGDPQLPAPSTPPEFDDGPESSLGNLAASGEAANAMGMAALAEPDAGASLVSVPGSPGAPVRLARCCTPVPPDELAGFVIRGGTVAVHQRECLNVQQMIRAGRAIVAAAWLPHQAEQGYRVTVQLEALDRPRLLADVTAAIDAAGGDITSASIAPPQQMRVRQTYTIRLADLASLPQLLRALRRVQGVYDVYRARPRLHPRVAEASGDN
ncbi:HD domain-containing protein [Yinghuangia sp. ASG 101]|uniref:RelA/SpoT family protein n=1 Tax=Yinghuangia sp. ASG 101 TaxID=2896848 RepID=UPI001E417D19|nr:HD domain-containing protein [Yinghuangia sp. ASG 101]UGQ09713.1 HD domain-containing protein [Yinghuangia sp. ASG 101]